MPKKIGVESGAGGMSWGRKGSTGADTSYPGGGSGGTRTKKRGMKRSGSSKQGPRARKAA
jgi:hypothetical protein